MLKSAFLLAITAAVAVAGAWTHHSTKASRRAVVKATELHGDRVRAHYEPRCLKAGLPWPPARLRLLAFKEERALEVWAAGPKGEFRKLESFPILGLSGGPGPKRREGDLQVPEGDYRLTTLNPDSKFHLSVRIDYPNDADIARSTIPVNGMGGDIYIHGGKVSIGCIAVGDSRIEEVFCLAAMIEDRRILIAPADLRRRDVDSKDAAVQELYRGLETALAAFK